MKITFVIIMCYVTFMVHATSQVPEVIIYDYVANDMYSTPLESFFSTNNLKPKVFYEYPPSTACWRGYVGTWKIEGGYLYLVSLRQGYPNTGTISLDKVDPKWVTPVKAVWFTGIIRLGKGKVLRGGMGFSEKREIDIFLEVKNGKVDSTRQVDNTKQKDVTLENQSNEIYITSKTRPVSINSKLFDKITSRMTLAEIVKLLGKGWMHPLENAGVISWFSLDGRIFEVWPENYRLNETITTTSKNGRGRMWMKSKDGKEIDIPKG
jgi:hypothetical protein